MRSFMIKCLPPLICLQLISCSLFEPKTGKSDTYTFFSSSLSNLSTILVYYPESFASSTPVIYLLNGRGADASAWSSGIDLEQEAYDRDIIFVSLTAGSYTYTNNTAGGDANYEDYILEVVEKFEESYEIEIDSSQRALCGISNGGGGAVYILSQHPDSFAACGSLSGTVYATTTNYSNLVNKSIRIDVGTEDEQVLIQLRWLKDRLNLEGADFDYYEHPGGHDWNFWKEYCPKQFDFLENIIASG